MLETNQLQLSDTIALFWEIADQTKVTEKYKIDKNLQYLKHAPLEILKKIFIQYRFFTQFYITDLALLISKLPDGELRSILADILNEELGSGNSLHAHPSLYDNFLLSLDIPKKELENADSICYQNLQTVQNNLLKKSWAYGVGLRGMGGECLCQIYLSTMHEFFSHNPHILKIEKQIDWTFWNIHIGEVDLHHQVIVRKAINELLILKPETGKDLLAGYLESKQSWDDYWARIFKVAQQPQKLFAVEA